MTILMSFELNYIHKLLLIDDTISRVHWPDAVTWRAPQHRLHYLSGALTRQWRGVHRSTGYMVMGKR